MKQAELREHLAQLQREAAALDDADEATKTRIASLIDTVAHQLDNPDDHEHKDGLVDQVSEAIEEFEVEHPRLIDTLNRIMVALGV